MFLWVDNTFILRKGTKDIVTDKSPWKSFWFFPKFGTNRLGTVYLRPPTMRGFPNESQRTSTSCMPACWRSLAVSSA